MKRIFSLYFAAMLLVGSVAGANTVYIISDSAVADYDPDVYPDQRGWGQMFRQFLVGDINLVNAARNGRSSKSFYTEGLWESTVRSKLQPGDYVLIQWNGNDEKNINLANCDANSLEHDPNVIGSSTVGTAPYVSFTEYNIKYIEETRAAGAIPVLMTPIVRCFFSGASISNRGAHNIWNTSCGTDDGTFDYPKRTRELAAEYDVDLLDITPKAKALVESYGPSDAKSILYVENDNSHLTVVGATLIARLVVQEMIANNILTANLNASPDILVNPSVIDFGNCYVNTFSSKSFTVLGMDLTPAEGQVSVSASEGFLVGVSETGEFSSNINIDYDNGNLALTNVFVRFVPAEMKEYSGSISVVQTGAQTEPKIITLTGNALSSANGVPVTVHFPLSADDKAIVEGPVISLGESYSKMRLNNYQNASGFTFPEGVTGTDKVQRNVIESGEWPGGEIDLVTDRYIQFAVKPQEGTMLTIDSIGLYIGASGGAGMGYRIMISNSEDFGSATTVVNKPNGNASNVLTAISYKPIWQIAENEGFYIRIYPWYASKASGKTICLQNLMIKGTSAVADDDDDDTPPTTVLYPLSTGGVPVVTGDAPSSIIAHDESFSNTAVLNYVDASGFTFPEGVTATGRVQRISLPNDEEWSTSSDLVSDRYIQFAVSPAAGKTFTVDSIGLYIATAGSSAIGYTIKASTFEDFDEAVVLAHAPSGNTPNVVAAISYTQKWAVNDGETLYLRVYPYQSGPPAARRICLKDVAIKGRIGDSGSPDGTPIILPNRDENKISLCPNPVNAGSPFTVGTSEEQGATVQIYNLSGQIIAQKLMTNRQMTLNAPAQQGTYVVKMKNAGSILIVK
jgi:lysophospholipase L1-like esterase